MSTNKSEVITFSIRLAGKDQIAIHDDLKAIVETSGRNFADVVRAILQIGIGSYKAGSTIGFDNKVILAIESKIIQSGGQEKNSDAKLETPVKLASKFSD